MTQITMPRYIRVIPLIPPRPLNLTVSNGGTMISLSLANAVPVKANPADTATHSQFLEVLIQIFSGGDYCRILAEQANTFFGEMSPSLVPQTPEGGGKRRL